MDDEVILILALLGVKDLGEMTVDMAQPDRDALEYRYNEFAWQRWQMVAEDGTVYDTPEAEEMSDATD